MTSKKYQLDASKRHEESTEGGGRTSFSAISGTSAWNLGMSPELKAKSRFRITSRSVPTSESRIGCINCRCGERERAASQVLR